MGSAGQQWGVRRAHRCHSLVGRRKAHTGRRRHRRQTVRQRQAGAEGDARDVRERRRGHDRPGRASGVCDTAKSVCAIQRETDIRESSQQKE